MNTIFFINNNGTYSYREAVPRERRESIKIRSHYGLPKPISKNYLIFNRTQLANLSIVWWISTDRLILYMYNQQLINQINSTGGILLPLKKLKLYGMQILFR